MNKHNIFISLLLFTIIIFFLPFACAILPSTQNSFGSIQKRSRGEINNIKKKLIEGAAKYYKASELNVNGKNFNMDCSGLVCAIYYYAGIDIQNYYEQYKGTGTERIYQLLKKNRLLKKNWLPKPGDIIFWDNTFDRNKNNRNDDILTHMGMVTECDKSGNITYIHFNYSKGIIYEYMNIRYKNNKTKEINGKNVTINSLMLIKESKTKGKVLAGQLFNSFGEAYYLK
jgi:hypothetical protein